jgi:zinc transport system permease protein
MALGIIFISWSPGYAPDLMTYLFGSILYVPAHYLLFVFALDVLIVGTVAALFKEFRAVTFDEETARVMGLPVGLLLQVLFALISLAVVVLIRLVGVILVIALLTIPAAIARQWTDGLLRMMLVATAVGAACTTAGLWLSYGLSERFDVNTPTGPLIIVLGAILYAVSTAMRGTGAGRGR